MTGSTTASGTLTTPVAARMKVTEWASVKADAARMTSRSRLEPAISASRNKMWSIPVSRCSAPNVKNWTNRCPALCSVLNKGCCALSAALPDWPSSS